MAIPARRRVPCQFHEADLHALQVLHSIQVQRLGEGVEAAIFRIVGEALINVERHSQSRYAHVSLTQQGEMIRLAVHDSGVGFDPECLGDSQFGLQGIKERARLMGATVSIKSAPEKGTRLTVEIPIQHTPAAPPG